MSGTRVRKSILFTSVIGPHGVDGPHSRYKNPMSLMANQVTRGQLYYGVQMFSRTFAYDLFGANLDANVAIVDFPTADQLRAALRERRWDRIGLSGIMANFEKVLLTYQIVRQALPRIPIDIGGHVVNDPEITEELTARMRGLWPSETFRTWQPAATGGDLPGGSEPAPPSGVTFVERDGLEYYRHLPGVGLKRDDVIYAPLVDTTFDKRALGVHVPGLSAGLVIPDVGCPMRCNFCTTSHKFGGRFVKFLHGAEDILAVADAHAARGVEELMVLSENFSLDTTRALELLRLMEQRRSPHQFGVFSSADALVRLGVETMVKLGYRFVWIGLEESSGTAYPNKMRGVELRSLVREMQAHGIEVLGSTILGFEHQEPADLDREIEHALSYGCTYNQFMLYMAMPGTALWKQMKADGRLKPGFPWADIHGQHVQNSDQEIEHKLDQAFARDFELLGPSILRMMQTHYDGYRATAAWEHELVQLRRAAMRKHFLGYIAALEAMRRDLGAMGHAAHVQARELRDRLIEECGWRGKLSALVAGPYVAGALWAEKLRFSRSVRRRKAAEPPCLVTHYGSFEHRASRLLPRPGVTPGSIAITRRAEARAEIGAVAAPAARAPWPRRRSATLAAASAEEAGA
jgi:radical SAM superfamily enzyme YgiQ (UPF0313 family)